MLEHLTEKLVIPWANANLFSIWQLDALLYVNRR